MVGVVSEDGEEVVAAECGAQQSAVAEHLLQLVRHALVGEKSAVLKADADVAVPPVPPPCRRHPGHQSAEMSDAGSRSQRHHDVDVPAQVRMLYHGDEEERTSQRVTDVRHLLLARLLHHVLDARRDVILSHFVPSVPFQTKICMKFALQHRIALHQNPIK